MTRRAHHGRGRPPSTSSETPEQARAYVQARWGEDVLNSADAVGWIEHTRALPRAHLAETNRAFRAARGLRSMLDERVLSSRLAEAERQATLIDRLFEHARARSPVAAADLRKLGPLAKSLRTALDALRAATREFSVRHSGAGGVAHLRQVAVRLEAYEKAPTRKNARALDDLTSDYEVELRVKVAQAVVARVPNIGRDVTTWAHWAIAVGLDRPCTGEELDDLRRSPGDELRDVRRSLWRRVLSKV